MASPLVRYDDPYQFTRPTQDGRTGISLPFIENGDIETKIYSLSLVVREEFYSGIKPGTEPGSVWEGGDPNAWNFPDTPRQPMGIGDLVKFVREYANVPGPQVTYPGSRYFPLPSIENDFGESDSLSVGKFNDYTGNNGRGYWSEIGALYLEGSGALFGPTRKSEFRTIGRATGGTFTMTYKTSTTAALNWNDTAPTIAAAINGLADMVTDGLSVAVTQFLNNLAGGSLGLIFLAGARSVEPITMDATALSVTTSNNPRTVILSFGAAQTVLIPDHYTLTAHGFDDTLLLAVVTSGSGVNQFDPGEWGVIDADTIWVPNSGEVNYIHFGTYLRQYTAGRAFLLRTRITSTFYLPGVTVGIATVEDIPLPPGLQNPSEFLLAIMTLTGWQTYETEGPMFWLKGPIYMVRETAINLDDFA